MKKNRVTVGADPELFIKNIATGEFVSAHSIIPGTKEQPVKVPYGAIQHDGVAAEFNIDPASTRSAFLKNILKVETLMERLVKNSDKNFTLVAEPTATFKEEYFKSLPEDVLLLGCEPDYDAYTLQANKKPSTTEPFRTGSGHIHIGWGDIVSDKFDKAHMEKCASLVRELDFVFTKSEHTWDTDTKRRQLYGNPGCFRPKEYGVEYRTLSNKWLGKRWTKMFVYDATIATTNLWLKGFSIVDKWNGTVSKPNSYSGICAFLERYRIPSTASYLD